MSVNHAEINPDQDAEAIVGDFFDSLDASDDAPEAAESDPGPSVAPEEGEDPDEDSESEEEAPEDAEEGGEPAAEDDELEEEELDPVEKRIRGLQSLHDRQMAEVRQQLTQMNQWAQTVYQQQLQQAQQQMQAQQAQAPQAQPDPSPEQLKSAVEGDLLNTWKALAPVKPHLVPRMIAMARDAHGNETADAMQVEYNSYLVAQQQAEARAQYEQIQQENAQREQPNVMREQMGSLVESVAHQYGEAFNAVQDQFIERAKETAPLFREWAEQEQIELTPAVIRQFLVDTLQEVREENLNKQASKPRKPRKQAPVDHMEGSTSGDRPEDLTPDQLAINEILEGARELSIDIVAPN